MKGGAAMNTHGHEARYYVSWFGGHMVVLSFLFLIQELILGFLPFWHEVHLGFIPLRPVVFAASSLWLDRRFFRVRGVE